MQRNTYMNSPGLLSSDYSLVSNPNLFFAGQITGVEGYIESTASGFLAAFYASCKFLDVEPDIRPGSNTMIGAMAEYISDSRISKFVPMNANFGIVLPIGVKFKGKTKKKDKNSAIAARSLEVIDLWKSSIERIKELSHESE